LVLRETAKGLAQQDAGWVKGIWVWASRFVSWASFGLIALASLVVWVWREQFVGIYTSTFIWGLLLIPLTAWRDLWSAALRGLHRIVQGLLPVNLIEPGILALLLSTMLLAGTSISPSQAMALRVAAVACALGSGAWLLSKATPVQVRHANFRLESRQWFQSVLPLAFINGIQLLNKNASILILGLFVPAEQVGFYRVAVQVSILASFGLQSMNRVVAPRFASLYARGETNRLQRLVTTSARVILGINLAVTLGFAFLGRWFLGVFFGARFVAAYAPLMILLVGQFINSATGAVPFLLNMTGHEGKTARGMAIAAGVNIVLNVLLVPLWDIQGAAAATAASMMVWNVLLWQAVRRQLGINSLAFHT
jgi:O-antigen/teichoic acid export membrane protein